jgi:hypothetical protein
MTEKETLQEPKDETPFEVEYFRIAMQTWGYDPSTSQLRNEIISECGANVFRVMFDSCGAAQTFAASRPYVNIYGRNVAVFIKETYGLDLQGGDMQVIALPMQFGWSSNSMRHIQPMKIRKGVAIIEANACLQTIVGMPPVHCVVWCHNVAEGICQACDPDSEYVFTHHILEGDDRCRAVIKKKSDKLSPEQLKRLEQSDPFQKIVQLDFPQVVTDIIMTTIAFNAFNIYTAVCIGLIGTQHTDELGAPLARKTGMKLGAKLMEGSERKGDLNTIKDKMDFLNTLLAQRGEPITITGSSMEKEIKDCPFKNGLPEQCKHLEGVFNGVCEAINPDYEFAYDRMMSKGEPTCHWVVRKKDVKQGKNAEQVPSDDPARALALRFAKGEISHEEFDRSMEILKKHSVVK